MFNDTDQLGSQINLAIMLITEKFQNIEMFLFDTQNPVQHDPEFGSSWKDQTTKNRLEILIKMQTNLKNLEVKCQLSMVYLWFCFEIVKINYCSTSDRKIKTPHVTKSSIPVIKNKNLSCQVKFYFFLFIILIQGFKKVIHLYELLHTPDWNQFQTVSYCPHLQGQIKDQNIFPCWWHSPPNTVYTSNYTTIKGIQ